jgi:hypothetical protein
MELSLGTPITTGTAAVEVLVACSLVVGAAVLVAATVVVVATVVVAPEVTDEATLELSKTPLSPPQAASSTVVIATTADHLALMEASSSPTTLGVPVIHDGILNFCPLGSSRRAPR